jgi:hypothetical protein
LESTKRVLSKDEIKRLEKLLRLSFHSIRKIRDSDTLASAIQYPKIPAIFSESLIIQASKKIFGPKYNAKPGGKQCDIELSSKGKQKLKVEIKATGDSSFQYFGEKDINADYLVWVSFGSYFKKQRPKTTIQILILSQPNKIFFKPTKITLKNFIKISKKHIKTKHYKNTAQLLS